jgi:hypothetical protein
MGPYLSLRHGKRSWLQWLLCVLILLGIRATILQLGRRIQAELQQATLQGQKQNSIFQ